MKTCKECQGKTNVVSVSLDVMKMALYDAKRAYRTYAMASEDGGAPSFWNVLRHPNELKIKYGI